MRRRLDKSGGGGRPGSVHLTMLHSMSYIGVFSLLLILYPKDGDAKDAESVLSGDATRNHSWNYFGDRSEEFSGGERLRESTFLGKFRRGVPDLSKPQEGPDQRQWLTQLHGSATSTLQALASQVTEILDRISRNWALEGAKTIQNGEIRLRKLNKDLTERVEELLVNGSKYGRHVRHCMNETIFKIDLEEVLDGTTGCYAKSLDSVHEELKKIEAEEEAILERMEVYGRKMFEMLLGCFLKDSAPGVIECLQKVDASDIGREIRDREAADLIIETAGIIKDIPRTFSECTSRGLLEMEALIRKGYAQSLSCLKARPGAP